MAMVHRYHSELEEYGCREDGTGIFLTAIVVDSAIAIVVVAFYIIATMRA
jgi:hypothetical protein